MKEKEPEFIVSLEELKKNQDRSYVREYLEKKEKRENRFEKFIYILGGIMVVMIIIALNVQYRNAVEECVEFGNSRTFCEEHLQ